MMLSLQMYVKDRLSRASHAKLALSLLCLLAPWASLWKRLFGSRMSDRIFDTGNPSLT